MVGCRVFPDSVYEHMKFPLVSLRTIRVHRCKSYRSSFYSINAHENCIESIALTRTRSFAL